MRKLGTKAILCLAISSCFTLGQWVRATDYTWNSTSDGDWADSANWSPNSVPGSTDNANFTLDGSYTATIHGGTGASINKLTFNALDASLLIQPDQNGGPADLSVNDGTITAGKLLIQSDTQYAPTLSVAGTLSIQAFGDMYIGTTSPDNAVAATITGNITNAGYVDDELNATINGIVNNNGANGYWSVGKSSGSTYVTQTLNGTFNQSAGDLAFNDKSSLLVSYSTFNFTGGQIFGSAEATEYGNNPSSGGAIILYDSTLQTTVSNGGGATFTGYAAVTLTSNLSANTSLVMISNNSQGPTALYVQNNATNYGTLTFRADDGQYSAYLQSADGTGNFNNNGTLNINQNVAGATMNVEAALVNNGTVNMNVDTYLDENASNEGTFNIGSGATLYMNDYRFNQDAGSLGNNGSTNFVITNGGFNYNGGKVNLTLYLHSSYFSVGVADGGGVAFNVYGGSTLNGNLPKNTSAYLLADNSNGPVALYVDNNASNAGTMVFRADGGYYNAYLQSGDGTGNFVNNGLITLTEDKTGGVMNFECNFVNNATVNMAMDTYLDGNASNEAQFNVTNSTLWMTNYRFNQDAGYLGSAANQHFEIHNGGFNFNGGTTYLTVDLYNSYLSTGVSNGGGTAFNMYGSCTLNGNLAPNTILFAEGDNSVGPTNVFVGNNAVNHGQMTFNAVGGFYGVDLHVGDDSGTFYNEGNMTFEMVNLGNFTDVYGNIINHSNGSITVFGSGNNTTFHGDVYNYGSFTIDPGAIATIGAGYTFIQDGTLVLGGNLVINDGGDFDPIGKTTEVTGKLSSSAGFNISSDAVMEALSGGEIVSAGGGNIVSAGGGNIVAAGGGNIVAAGGGNIVAAGGGNVISNDGGSIVAAGGGNAIVSNAIRSNASINTGPSYSIIAQSGGTITLGGGSISADNAVEIDAGGLLTGHGTLTSTSATNAGKIVATGGTLEFENTQLDNTGLIDIAGGTLLLDQGLAEDVLTQIQSGYDNGKWDGTSGITCSLAANNSAVAIGYSIDGPAVTLMYTWVGDANMDGIVDSADFAMISATGDSWSTGDFNYDGVVNADDYALYMLGAASGGSTNISATLPEPSLLGCALVFGLTFARSRRVARMRENSH